MNKFDEMRQAVKEAQATLEAADSVAARMAPLLRGRLRKCSHWDLKALKKELQNYNIHTGKWKD